MRIEVDSLGQVRVADEALWGAQTQRAIENYRISGLRPPSDYIIASAMVKRAAAEVNMALGQLDAQRPRNLKCPTSSLLFTCIPAR